MSKSNIDSLLSLIAQKHLGIETLEIRNRDCLDFHDVSVIGVKAALNAAFIAGCKAGVKTPPTTRSDVAE